MKKLTLFVLTSTLFAISVQAQVGPEQARNYQINETHTGAINVSGVLPPLKQKWSRNFGQDMSYPLIADGKVYVTVRYASVFGTELYALNAADGATLWSYPLGGSFSWSAICYENGRVFALNNKNSATIRIDSTLPTVQNSFSGPVGGNGYYKGPVQFTMTGTDNLSGLANIYYRVNGGATLVYSSPFTIGVDGNHSVDYWSIDVAGNVSGVGNALVKIDVSAPLTQATGSGTAGTNGWYRSAQASIAATDNLSGVQTTFYKVDGGTTKTYTTAFSVSGNGLHTVNFWSVDKATNTETMGSLAINIDSTQPGVTCNVSPATAAKSSNPVTITVTGHATDTVSGVSITDGATFSVVDEYGVTQPSGPITLQSNGNYSFTLILQATKNVGDSAHVYTITVRGADRTGNTNTASDTLKIN